MTIKIGAIESLPDPEPQQHTIAADQIPHPISEPHPKKDQILIGPGKEINFQGMDQWSVFMENLRYTVLKLQPLDLTYKDKDA